METINIYKEDKYLQGR